MIIVCAAATKRSKAQGMNLNRIHAQKPPKLKLRMPRHHPLKYQFLIFMTLKNAHGNANFATHQIFLFQNAAIAKANGMRVEGET